MLDFVLAATHHLAAFLLLALLTSQFTLLKKPLDPQTVRRVAYLDAGYGLSALTLLCVGLSRAVYAAKGWLYYSHSLTFWLKLTVFGLIAVVSIYPTLMYRKWFQDAANPVPADAQRRVYRCICVELSLFVFLPVLAAAMARGIGS